MRKILFLSIFLVASTYAQITKVYLSSDSVSLGEVCTLGVVFDKEIKAVSLLNPVEWAGGVRFRDTREIFSTDVKKYQILLSFYETPICTIPQISFLIETDGGGDTVKTEPIAVRVPSMFEKMDTNQLKKVQTFGLSDPMKAGKLPVIQIIMIFATIIILTILIIMLIKKVLKEKKAPIPIIPPFEEAIAALQELDSRDLIDKGEYKMFVFELSAILKRFISRRYEVLIEEATSTEFKQWLKKSELSRENKILLEKFINETDPVKFADLTPSINILRELRNNVEEFVKITRPIENLPLTESRSK